MNFDNNEFVRLIEKSLKSYLPESNCLQAELIKAMEYSLLSKGKRIRALLTARFCMLCGGDIDMSLPFACAVEMIHAYSLIHDDLPCMDDDDLRRGKPSCHIAFSESTALLAGDALQALAFETMLGHYDKQKVTSKAAAQAALELAAASGALGMCGGQAIDLDSQNSSISLEVLNEMHSKKTGALITAAGKMGCIIAGADTEKISSCETYCKKVGLVFQIIDDILDFVGTTETLGKKVGADLNSNKSTYASILGVDKSYQIAKDLTKEAKDSLEVFGSDAEFLCNLADNLIFRQF